MAHDISTRMGYWEGRETIEVILLNDCHFVINMDFLHLIEALRVPSKDCISIIDARSQYTVLAKRQMGREGRRHSEVCSSRGGSKMSRRDKASSVIFHQPKPSIPPHENFQQRRRWTASWRARQNNSSLKNAAIERQQSAGYTGWSTLERGRTKSSREDHQNQDK